MNNKYKKYKFILLKVKVTIGVKSGVMSQYFCGFKDGLAVFTNNMWNAYWFDAENKNDIKLMGRYTKRLLRRRVLKVYLEIDAAEYTFFTFT